MNSYKFIQLNEYMNFSLFVIKVLDAKKCVENITVLKKYFTCNECESNNQLKNNKRIKR